MDDTARYRSLISEVVSCVTCHLKNPTFILFFVFRGGISRSFVMRNYSTVDFGAFIENFSGVKICKLSKREYLL